MPTPEPALYGNLLTEPLIGVRTIGGARQQVTLPGVFALLADTGIILESFTGLQAHQAHAWHAFTVQLASMICQRAGVSLASQNEAWWRDRLRDLGGGDEAWSLVVTDLSKPAFMQSGVAEGSLGKFRSTFLCPEDFDVPITTKNHDRKSSRGGSDLEPWLMTLITTQTMQGYSGSLNHGIFRMNSGCGNRPGIGYADPENLGAWFRSDVLALIKTRDDAVAFGFNALGQPLLWAVPWDGDKSLGFSDIDPWCIECCRRVRLVHRQDGIRLVQAPTNAARVRAPEGLTGNVGDPWTPVASDLKALTLPAGGFSYRRVQDLLFGSDWTPPAAQHTLDNATMWVGRTLVRGNCKTNGYHERYIPITSKARLRLLVPDGKAELAKRAVGYVSDVGDMRNRVLWPALKALAGEHNEPSRIPLDCFEARADAAFFSHLWEHVDTDQSVARQKWQQDLRVSAELLHRDVLRTALPGAALRWRRISESESRFKHGLFTHFKTLMETSQSEVHA